MKNISLIDWFYQDNYIVSYFAYDNKKKCYCYIDIAKKPTSWTYCIYY